MTKKKKGSHKASHRKNVGPPSPQSSLGPSPSDGGVIPPQRHDEGAGKDKCCDDIGARDQVLLAIAERLTKSSSREIVTFAITTLIALGGVAAALLSFWTYQRTLEESINTTKLDQRAWIGVVGELKANGWDDGSGIVFDVPIMNTGKTPANGGQLYYRARTMGECVINIDEEAYAPPYSLADNQYVFQPQAPFVIHVHTDDADISGNWGQILTGSKKVCIYGLISFVDIFSRKWKTHFCHYPQIEKGKITGFPACIVGSDTQHTQ